MKNAIEEEKVVMTAGEAAFRSITVSVRSEVYPIVPESIPEVLSGLGRTMPATLSVSAFS